MNRILLFHEWFLIEMIDWGLGRRCSLAQFSAMFEFDSMSRDYCRGQLLECAHWHPVACGRLVPTADDRLIYFEGPGVDHDN